MVAVLAMVITVIAIAVQLAAGRRTPRVASRFVRDRINRSVPAVLAVCIVLVLWIDSSLRGPEVPVAVAVVGSCAMRLCLLLPYVTCVLYRLSPAQVTQGIVALAEGALSHAATRGPPGVPMARREVLEGLDQLADMARHGVRADAKPLAVSALRRPTDVACRALDSKGAPKVLRAFQVLYRQATGDMPDVNQIIARRHALIARRHALRSAAQDPLLGLLLRVDRTSDDEALARAERARPRSSSRPAT